ncbi:hypothetical protein Salat_1697200 [Sesamum alatum]|uniref:Uncharacterized protein n=1 Tax=Sesamum alatum TaxID=300844 RepID=A0AAE1Y7B0_9LAMI|nr:hypothetical protein Salat_1697200 [Sesamum alatum]
MGQLEAGREPSQLEGARELVPTARGGAGSSRWRRAWASLRQGAGQASSRQPSSRQGGLELMEARMGHLKAGRMRAGAYEAGGLELMEARMGQLEAGRPRADEGAHGLKLAQLEAHPGAACELGSDASSLVVGQGRGGP